VLHPSFRRTSSFIEQSSPSSRQKKLDRAPATIVSNLPERVWTPEGWEKDDDDLVEVGRKNPTTDEETPLLPPETGGPATLGTLSVPVPKPLDSAEDGQPEATSSTPTPQPTRHKYFSKDECAICLQSFQRGDRIRILPCGHIFHKEEVDDWLIRWKKLVRRGPCDWGRRAMLTRATFSCVTSVQCVGRE
jgi:hypothetical protein